MTHSRMLHGDRGRTNPWTHQPEPFRAAVLCRRADGHVMTPRPTNDWRFPEPTDPVDEGWRFVSIGFEHQAVEVDGISLWDVTWNPTGRKITVAHPSYPSQRHHMPIYEAADTDSVITFAAGEFSNGVWGFFLPE